MSDLRAANEWVEKCFEDGESCFECRFFYSEHDINFSECQVVDPYDCPALPEPPELKE